MYRVYTGTWTVITRRTMAAPRSVFENFTDKSLRTVVLAEKQARMLGHDYIGTEHLLLGLIEEGQGVAARALESLDITYAAARQQVEEIVGRGQQANDTGDVQFNPRAKEALQLSRRQALALGHNYIGTEHLLLGLIGEDPGPVIQVLAALAGDPDRIRQQVIRLLHGQQGHAGPGAA
jgi:ATP-dependent Clp protease ATP-binding subunit ClpC